MTDSQHTTGSAILDFEGMDLDAYAELDQEYASVPPAAPEPEQLLSPTHGKTSMTHLGPQNNSTGEAKRLLTEKVAAATVAADKAKAEVRRTVGGADEGQQVDRLATGVTVDAGALTSVCSLFSFHQTSPAEQRCRGSHFLLVFVTRKTLGSGRAQRDHQIRGRQQ